LIPLLLGGEPHDELADTVFIEQVESVGLDADAPPLLGLVGPMPGDVGERCH
jgi:hypothetical protein